MLGARPGRARHGWPGNSNGPLGLRGLCESSRVPVWLGQARPGLRVCRGSLHTHRVAACRRTRSLTPPLPRNIKKDKKSLALVCALTQKSRGHLRCSDTLWPQRTRFTACNKPISWTQTSVHRSPTLYSGFFRGRPPGACSVRVLASNLFTAAFTVIVSYELEAAQCGLVARNRRNRLIVCPWLGCAASRGCVDASSWDRGGPKPRDQRPSLKALRGVAAAQRVSA